MKKSQEAQFAKYATWDSGGLHNDYGIRFPISLTVAKICFLLISAEPSQHIPRTNQLLELILDFGSSLEQL
ncbi:unnamed protein product [Victoria cruziana]